MYNLITSARRRKDPITGKAIRPGEICFEDQDGDRFHIDRLPARKLIPLKEYLKANKTSL